VTFVEPSHKTSHLHAAEAKPFGGEVPPRLETSGRVSHFRWVICALLFFATTINYIDRQVIGVLKPTLQNELGWTETDYGNIVFAFQLAYAAGYLATGRLMDRIGVRLGFSLAVMLWSIAAMGHGLVRSVTGFCLARFGLGLAEGGNFPAAIKTVSDWFPKKERALATGVFNAGSNVGALLTPLLVPWLTYAYGWPAAFYCTGGLGLLWLIAWLLIYSRPERHPRVSPAELAFIESDPPDPAQRIPWLELLRYRQTWAFAIAMFITSPIWWFYLYWVPDFLHKTHNLDLIHLGPPLVVIYLMADFGSVLGGWFSSALIQRGWSVVGARKFALLICALLVVPIFLVPNISNLWTVVLLIGLAASAHQGWSANLFTLVSDTMPRQSVASVVGIGGFAAAIGGMCIAKFVGYVLDTTGSYVLPFLLAATAYPVALAILHVLQPRHAGPTHTPHP
jgi:MFS transporter, ACS family, hexuronate transporter